MGNGEWGMVNGEWAMGSGEWKQRGPACFAAGSPHVPRPLSPVIGAIYPSMASRTSLAWSALCARREPSAGLALASRPA